MRAELSDDERDRADRFHGDHLRDRYTVAHAGLRRILSRYTGVPIHALQFDVTSFGKPFLAATTGTSGVQFNLSHSADLALVAVTSAAIVGVDIERWDTSLAHLELAQQFFSAHECAALRALSGSPLALTRGFFFAWSRKEAYLKATGHGVSRGLHHFDVSLSPGDPARLLADRLDHDAPSRWAMANIDVGQGYSAAVVTEAPLRNVVFLEFPA